MTSLDMLQDFFKEQADCLLTGPRPFAEYMRAKFKEKGVLQQNIFLAADISENYGYKLISQEKHTVQRDTIIRICLAARFSLDETQIALILYGMAPLYIRIPRDVVFLSAINHRLYDVYQVNDILLSCGQLPLFSKHR